MISLSLSVPDDLMDNLARQAKANGYSIQKEALRWLALVAKAYEEMEADTSSSRPEISVVFKDEKDD